MDTLKAIFETTIIVTAVIIAMAMFIAMAWASLSGRFHKACKPEEMRVNDEKNAL